MSSISAGSKNVLTSWVPQYPQDVDEWIKRFEEAQGFSERRGLIYDGFSNKLTSLSIEAQVKRLCYYLDLADHWSYESSFRRENGDPDIIIRDRKMISRLAFEFVCLQVFKNTSEQYERRPSWAGIVEHPVALEKIMWFFRSDLYGRFENLRLGSLEKDRFMQYVVDFLLGLVDYVWKFQVESGRGSHRDEELAIRERFNALKPQLVRILEMLGKLDRLLGIYTYPLGFKEMRELSRIALEKTLDLAIREHRKPVTLGEAVLGMSSAAQTLLLLRTMYKTRKRLQRKAKARADLEQAQQQLKRLGK